MHTLTDNDVKVQKFENLSVDVKNNRKNAALPYGNAKRYGVNSISVSSQQLRMEFSFGSDCHRRTVYESMAIIGTAYLYGYKPSANVTHNPM